MTNELSMSVDLYYLIPIILVCVASVAAIVLVAMDNILSHRTLAQMENDVSKKLTEMQAKIDTLVAK